MKTMKKMIALLLCLLLCAGCLAGCGSEPTVVGTWKLDMGLLDAVKMADADAATAFTGFASEARIEGFTIAFTEDGKVTTTASTSQISASVESFMNEYLDYLSGGGMYALLEQEGVSRETADDYLAMMGMTIDELVDSMREEMADGTVINQMAEEMAQAFAEKDVEQDSNGNYVKNEIYKLENDTITVAEDEASLADGETMTFALSEDGNTMTLTKDGSSMPFTRVQ